MTESRLDDRVNRRWRRWPRTEVPELATASKMRAVANLRVVLPVTASGPDHPVRVEAGGGGAARALIKHPLSGPIRLALVAFNRSLRRRQPRNRHTIRRARNVVHPNLEAELH